MTKEEFKNIYDQHFDAIRRYLFYRSGNTELATDLAQEAFIKVWEKQFDNADGKIKSLLYKVAGDLFLNHIRHEKVVLEYAQDVHFRYKDEVFEREDNSEALKQKYEAAIGKLPDKQRVVFLMNRMENLTYKEISEALEVSVKAIEKRMSKALKTLKQEIKR